MAAPSLEASPRSHRFLQATDPASVQEMAQRFAAPAAERRRVQILRAFSVVARSELSIPVAPPIGPVYLAAMLRKAGYAVDVIDAIGEDITRTELTDCGRFRRQGLAPEAILNRIHPDTAVLGVSMLFSEEWLEHRALLRRIRAARPDLVIVAGGEHATALSEYVLRDCPAIDYVVRSEGEFSFLELVHHLFTGQGPCAASGLAYLDPEGSYVETGPSRRIADFGNLPRPAWDLIPVSEYPKAPNSHGIDCGLSLPILATRGCPFQCTFCSSPSMWSTRYLMRDPADVVDEIEGLVVSYGVQGINFVDLTAFTKKKWVLELCRGLQARGLRVSLQLPSGTRSEALDEEALRALHAAHCRQLTYAPESGSERTLAVIKKKVSLAAIEESMEAAIRIGLSARMNIIIGFPHETRRDIYQSARFCLRMARKGLDDCFPWLFSAYPGSELYQKLTAEGSVPEPCDDYFLSLHGMSNFALRVSKSSRLPLWELNLYRVAITVLFYAIAYLLYPRRLARLLRSSIRPGTFSAQNLLEQRLYENYRRMRSSPARAS
ncbi:MAG: radical SAM protein [Myxococcota bacterium]